MLALAKEEIKYGLERLGFTEESEVNARAKEYEKFIEAVRQNQEDRTLEH